MKIGLVGFPGSGKTTVFNALTGLAAETGYGATRGRTNLGVVKVPDARVDALSALFHPKKTTYAEIAFSDVAAAPAGAHTQGLDPQTLAAMREMDALCQVVRGFVGPAGEPPAALADVEALEVKMKAQLDAGRPLRELSGLLEAEWSLVSGFRFLSQKPLLLVLNVPESKVTEPAPAALSE